MNTAHSRRRPTESVCDLGLLERAIVVVFGLRYLLGANGTVNGSTVNGPFVGSLSEVGRIED